MIKGIFRLFPRSLREKIKIYYYSRRTPGFKFTYNNRSYITTTNEWSIKTYSPLYFTTKEILRYERYYKLKEEDVVVDAGAFNGILSLVYSQKASKGTVYSFEPDSKNRVVAGENFALNNNPSNINLLKKGLWSNTGEIEFFAAGTVASSAYYRPENSEVQKITVVSLDDFIQEKKINKLDFIKMDVEGAELEILKGAAKCLEQLRPHLSIASYHLVNGELTYKSLESFFKKINYPYKTEFYPDGEIITYAGPNLNQK